LKAVVRSFRGLCAAGLSVILAGGLAGLAEAQTSAQGSSTSPATTSRTSLARKAAAARARRAAAARRLQAQQREAMTPRFKADALGNLVPDVRAAAAIIYNPQTGDVLWESNSHDQRSIASLTKIMTAVTFIADDPDLVEKVTVTRTDVARASITHLRAGETVSYTDLLHLTLIASDNAAARVLARTAEGGTAAFIARMNQMAVHLGLTNSRYFDPSGLDARNVSSAYDLSHLIAFANSDERLGPIMRKEAFDVTTSRRSFSIRTTNKLLGSDVDVVAGKTGFIRKAGYCLATLLQAPHGAQVAVVVLGATNSTVRFWETRHLFNWAVNRMQGVIATATAPFVPAQD
jgi:D-alanyl-D-alanine endopeptidase (penicillin-binding protein 7)